MDALLAIDWKHLLEPTVPPLELVLRGTVMYLGILVVVRMLLRREAAAISLPDLLMVVLLSDAAQNAMADNYSSLTDGVILVGTIILWNYTLDRLAFHVPFFTRLVHPPPLPLVRNGQLLKRNMRMESISEDELMSQLRQTGVDDIAKVKVAHIEGDGRISVIKRE
ncbi:MAG: DUF421 domain-containing protein [Gammaproteobacteria bacterium]